MDPDEEAFFDTSCLNDNETQQNQFVEWLRSTIDLAPLNGQEVKITHLCRLLPGSHIAVRGYDNVYWHHGIYVGEENDEMMFIHMTGDKNPNAASISKCSSKVFLNKVENVVVVKYDNDSDIKRVVTIQLATMLLDNFERYPRLYNLRNFNCEHFATIVRTGKQRYVAVVKEMLSSMRIASCKPSHKNDCLLFAELLFS